MDVVLTPDVASLLATPDPAAPVLTYCDDRTGERTTLSAAQLGIWSARTATLLRQGCGLDAGDEAAVLLPAHWQTAAVVLGAWSAGMTISFRSAATAGLAQLGETGHGPLDVTFVSAVRLDDWLEDVPEARHQFVLGLAPDGATLPEVPAGYRDYLAEVGRYPAGTPPYTTISGAERATADGTTFDEWWRLTEAVRDQLGLRSGDRLLVDTAAHDHPLWWLLAPLAAGASVVLCANLDPADRTARAAAEGATRIL